MFEFVLRELPAGYLATAVCRGDLTIVIADPRVIKHMHETGQVDGPAKMLNRVVALLEESPDPSKRVSLRLAS